MDGCVSFEEKTHSLIGQEGPPIQNCLFASSMAVDWTQLPPELLEKISNSLSLLADYIRFQSVCRAWRFSIPKTPTHLPPQLPWLMLPPSLPHQSHRAFFDLSANTFHFLPHTEYSSRKRHLSSSNGCLVLLDRDSPDIVLINPLTRSKLHLPPLSSFPNVIAFNYSCVGGEYVLRARFGSVSTRSLREMNSFLKKIVLSCSPFQGSGFVAMAILSDMGELAYCRGGDKSWKIIPNVHGFGEDILYSNGFFYAVNKVGGIVVCDVRDDSSSPTVSFIDITTQIDADMQYLASSGDELLLISRFLDLNLVSNNYDVCCTYRTNRFAVYRLNSIGWPWWEAMNSLGDRTLFVGVNSSLFIRASDFSGCMGNCIYYTDDYSESNYDGLFGGDDLGIFKLADGSIEQLPCHPHISPSQICWPPPLWVSPSPC